MLCYITIYIVREIYLVRFPSNVDNNNCIYELYACAHIIYLVSRTNSKQKLMTRL